MPLTIKEIADQMKNTLNESIQKSLKRIQKADHVHIIQKGETLETHFQYGNYTEVVDFGLDGDIKEKDIEIVERYLESWFFLYGFLNGEIKPWSF